jgi:hypothetical protein
MDSIDRSRSKGPIEGLFLFDRFWRRAVVAEEKVQ